jgi:benzoyl-CoA reductase/2-hydroxyglutaryl-CoA dehydratase subunit BcrC/BadD/HgdB
MSKFAEIVSRELDVPYYLVDIPHVSESIPDYHLQHAVGQFKNLIQFLEKTTGRKLDLERLQKTLELSFQASKLWMEILELSTVIPSPIDALDIYRHMFPLLTLRGTERAVEYYKILRHEVYDRVNNDVSAVVDEKYRLLWDYLPIYHKMNFLSRVLSKRGAAIATSTFFFPLPIDACEMCYEEVPIFRKGYDEMLESLARDNMQLYPNTSLEKKFQTIQEIVEKFSIDGVLIHCDRSCKPQSLPQYQMKNMIEKQLGVNCLLIDSDSVDPRFFSEEQVVTRMEAFLECLPAEKR